MCMSSEPAHFSDTRLYVGRAVHKKQDVHVLCYQNKAISETPNCMILPFPAKEPMTAENIIDTSESPRLLEDMADACRVFTKSIRRSLSLDSYSFNSAPVVQVFESGSYTVLLSESCQGMPAALSLVDEKKRPKISKEMLDGMEKLYPNHHFAICCWQGSVEAEPLLWYYVPQNPDSLFFPTMDAHDGKPPVVDSMVYVDAWYLTKSEEKGNKVYYGKYPQGYQHLLPINVVGTSIRRALPNGDFTMTDEGWLERGGYKFEMNGIVQ